MDGKLYDDLVQFLDPKTQTLPTSFPSNASNFRRDAAKFDFVDGALKRNGKFVIREDGLEDAWEQYHLVDVSRHSGNKPLTTKKQKGGKPTCLFFRNEQNLSKNEWLFLDERHAKMGQQPSSRVYSLPTGEHNKFDKSKACSPCCHSCCTENILESSHRPLWSFSRE